MEAYEERIGVCGAGTIGAALAVLATGNGMPVVIVGNSESGLARCRAAFERHWRELTEKKVAPPRAWEAARALLTVTNDYGALADATFVFEASAEQPEVKAQVYERIEAACADDAVVASCTSSLTADTLAAFLRRRERFLIAHPFQPAHLLPLFELAPCGETAEGTMARAQALLEYCGRQVVRLRRDVPGLLVNRLAQALYRECLYLLEQGVCGPAELDRAVKWAVGKRYASIGLLEYFDDVGFALEREIAANVYPSLCADTAPQETVRRGLQTGETGRAAGKGLYDWTQPEHADYLERKSAPYFEECRWHWPGEGGLPLARWIETPDAKKQRPALGVC